MRHLGRELYVPLAETAEVLLADCWQRAGLAVARSLERAGVPVVALAHRRDNMVFRSRYVKRRVIVPYLETDPEGFIEHTWRAADDYGVRLAIPVTDPAIRLFDRNRDAFPPELKLALPDSQAIHNVIDKRSNLEIARSVGVPCPKEFVPDSAAQVTEMIAALGLPVVLKNPSPESQDEDTGLPFRYMVVHDEETLAGYVDEYSSYPVKPLYQEYASGRTYNICCFAADGDTLAIHQYLSRRRGAHAGIFREIVPLRPDMEEHARRLLRALRWSGVAHIQFIESLDSEKYWYMETNGRFWASTQGTVNAGWDVPYWYYRYFLTGEKPVVGPIQVGSQTVYRCGDLDAMLHYLAGGPSPTVYTDPGKWWAVRQYIASFSPKVRSDVCDWRDPLPGVYSMLGLAGRYFDAVMRRVTRRPAPPWVRSADRHR
jgi:predicted ATP-grasp superfamily ATP-dependent carboligase